MRMCYPEQDLRGYFECEQKITLKYSKMTRLSQNKLSLATTQEDQLMGLSFLYIQWFAYMDAIREECL